MITVPRPPKKKAKAAIPEIAITLELSSKCWPRLHVQEQVSADPHEIRKQDL